MSRDNKKKTNTKSRKKSPEKKKKSVIMKNPISEKPFSEHFLVNKAFQELTDLQIRKDEVEEDIPTLPDGTRKRLLEIELENLPDKITQKSEELHRLQDGLQNLPTKIKEEEEKSWFTKKPYKLFNDLEKRNQAAEESYLREKEKALREKIPFDQDGSKLKRLNKITNLLGKINLQNPDPEQLGMIGNNLYLLENFLKTQEENYTKKRKEKGSIEIDKELRKFLLENKKPYKTTPEKLGKFGDNLGQTLTRFDIESLETLLAEQEKALNEKKTEKLSKEQDIVTKKSNGEPVEDDKYTELRTLENDILECGVDIKNTEHDILFTKRFQEFTKNNPEDVLNREKISKIGEEYEKGTGIVSDVKKPLTSVKDFVTKNHQGLLDRGKWKNSTSILIGIFMLFLLVLGGMFADSVRTLGGSNPTWTFSKREIENSKVKNHKNLSKQSAIVFFVFALFLIVLLFINFRKTESKDVVGRGPRDTSGVGNFFKGISKYHEGAWLTISIVFLIGAIACLFVTFSDKDVYEDSYWIYSFVFFSSIFIFLVFWSIGRSQDSPFLNELYHHDGLKNLNSQIEKWKNNRSDAYLKKNVTDSINKLNAQYIIFNALDKESKYDKDNPVENLPKQELKNNFNDALQKIKIKFNEPTDPTDVSNLPPPVVFL